MTKSSIGRPNKPEDPPDPKSTLSSILVELGLRLSYFVAYINITLQYRMKIYTEFNLATQLRIVQFRG